jgi:hypothetical protein
MPFPSRLWILVIFASLWGYGWPYSMPVYSLREHSTRLLLKMILPSMILPILFFDKTNRI